MYTVPQLAVQPKMAHRSAEISTESSSISASARRDLRVSRFTVNPGRFFHRLITPCAEKCFPTVGVKIYFFNSSALRVC